MSAPVQVVAKDGFANGCPQGPYDAGASGLFVVVNDALGALIEIYRSSDSGVTWVLQDGGNSIVPGGGATGGASCFDSTAKVIYVAYWAVGDTLHYKPFDCATSTWGADVPGGPALTPGFVGQVRVAQRSTGPIVILYGDRSGATIFSNLVENTIPAWGASVPVASNLGVNVDFPVDITPGAAGRVHCYTNESGFGTGDLRHASLDVANVLSAITTVASAVNAGASGPDNGSRSQGFYDATGNVLYIPGITLTTGEWHLFSAPEAASPGVWTDTDLGNPYVPAADTWLPQDVSVIVDTGGNLQNYRMISTAGTFSILGVGVGNIGGYISAGALFSMSVGLVSGTASMLFSEDPANPASTLATRTMFIGPAAGPGPVGAALTTRMVNALSCASIVFPFVLSCCRQCEMPIPMQRGKVVYASSAFEY